MLDVGTASGFLSFESERAGAREVVSFDKESMLQQRIPPIRGAPWYEDPERWAEENQERDLRVKRGYWLAHRALGSRARAFYGDLFALPTELGDFDVAIVAAILQHVNDPIGALASIVRLRPRTLIVTDRMLEGEAAVARLHKPDPSTNAWWFYSTGAFREVLDMLGYQIEHLGRARYRFAKGGRNVEMTTIVATSR